MAQKTWWQKVWRPLSVRAGWLLEYLSPLAFINSLVPKDGFDKHSGIAYGQLERQKLDVYVPRNGGQDLPVVVFFYGGTWQSGRRQDYLFVAEALTAPGFIAVIPDYRVYPEARFPTFIEDGAAAVTWVRNHIGDFGGGASRLFLMGHSAGAYIAAMLALNPSYLAQVGMSPNELKGFIGLAGPYDFLPLKRPRLIKIFGGADDIPETQPVNFVSGHPPLPCSYMVRMTKLWDPTTRSAWRNVCGKREAGWRKRFIRASSTSGFSSSWLPPCKTMNP